ncbi:hypothetical protein D8M21_01940 [Kocuria sp. HSID16901]|nr:hypothetical protein D8M21_01940 [Kocuria sp. HSID16901]
MEQRCTLTHELVHHARGHSGHQKAGVERKVRYETALLLLPTIDYHEPDLPVWFMAEEYGVTEAVMRDRLKIEQHRHKQQTRKTQAGTNHRDADNPQNQKEQ